MFISSHWYIVWIAGHNEWDGLIYIDALVVMYNTQTKNPTNTFERWDLFDGFIHENLVHVCTEENSLVSLICIIPC